MTTVVPGRDELHRHRAELGFDADKPLVADVEWLGIGVYVCSVELGTVVQLQLQELEGQPVVTVPLPDATGQRQRIHSDVVL